MVDGGLGEAEGDKLVGEESVPCSGSFADAVQCLVELADEASASRGGDMIALGLFHVDVGDDVIV